MLVQMVRTKGDASAMNAQPDTFIQRRPADRVTPAYEDAGLFKTPLVMVDVHLTPDVYRNHRHDVIVRSKGAGGLMFEVVFAGRRCVAAAALLTRLEAIKQKALADAQARKAPAPDLQSIVFPVNVEGVWRRRFAKDPGGWETCFHQMVASRWTVIGPSKTIVTFGAEPAVPLARFAG